MVRSKMLTLGVLLTLGFASVALEESRGQAGPATGKDLYDDPLPPGALARVGTVRWRHSSTVEFVAFLPDGKSVLSVGSDRIIRVWDYPSGKEIRRFDPPNMASKAVAVPRALGVPNAGVPIALSKDGKTLACDFAASEILLYDVATGKLRPSLKGDPGIRLPGGGVTALDFSPDGQHLAVSDPGGGIRVWDWAKAKEVHQIGRKQPQVRGFGAGAVLTYSPDGKYLAASQVAIENNQLVASLKLWNPDTAQEMRTISTSPNGGLTFAAAFSPDSSKLAVLDAEANITLFETDTGKELTKIRDVVDQRLPGRFGLLVSLVFSKDGQSLFTRAASSPRIREWDIVTGKERRQLGSDPAMPLTRTNLVGGFGAGGLSRLMVSPDGDTLAFGGYDQAIHFIDIAGGKEVHLPSSDPVIAVSSVQFTPDGKGLWTQHGNDATLRQWDPGTGKAAGSLKLPAGAARPVISHDGRFVAVQSGALAVQILEAATGKEVGKVAAEPGDALPFVAFSPDGNVIALRWRAAQKITLHQVNSGKLLHSIAVLTGDPGRGGVAINQPVAVASPAMLFAPDGKTLVAFGEPNKLVLWDVATGKKVRDLGLPARALNSLTSAAFSPDGRCLAVDMRDGTVALCEVASGTERRLFGKMIPRPKGGLATPTPRGTTVADSKPVFSQDGTKLAHGGADQVVRVWDVTTGEELAAFPGHTGAITAVAFATGGKMLASASTDTTALVWDLAAVHSKALPARALSDAELQARWTALVEPDGIKAFAAICELAGSPKETVPLIMQALQPAPPLDGERVQQLLTQLDSEKYKERQQAGVELLKMGERVVPALQKALASQPALELQRRLDGLLDQLAGPKLSGDEEIRTVRAVEVLERIGTPEARQALQRLAEGAPGRCWTVASQSALQRMSK